MNPEDFPKARTIQTIRVDDDRGRQEFSGPHRVSDACAYEPKGDAAWSVQRLDGSWRPLPARNATQPVAYEPPPPIRTLDTDAIRLALEYGDRNSQLVAKAYADAFKVAGSSWASVVAPLAGALEALSRRIVTLEERLEDAPQPLPPPEPQKPNALDELAEGVLAGVVQGAMAAKG